MEMHQRDGVRYARWLGLWLVYAAIAAGVGYPILNRYDPTQLHGTSDTRAYAAAMTGEPGTLGRNSYRVLQPMVGRPVYLLFENGIGAWNPVTLGLLFSSAVFIGGACCLIVVLARRYAIDATTVYAAPLLFLCNFWVANSMAIGMADASECFLLLLCLCLLEGGAFWALPAVGLVGGLAKETFVPLSFMLAAGWWWAGGRALAPHRRLGFIAGVAGKRRTNELTPPT
jgi:hypothetical protein